MAHILMLLFAAFSLSSSAAVLNKRSLNFALDTAAGASAEAAGVLFVRTPEHVKMFNRNTVAVSVYPKGRYDLLNEPGSFRNPLTSAIIIRPQSTAFIPRRADEEMEFQHVVLDPLGVGPDEKYVPDDDPAEAPEYSYDVDDRDHFPDFRAAHHDHWGGDD